MDFLSIIHSFQIETIISQELDLDPPSPNLPAEDYLSKFRTRLKILSSELIFESLKCTQSNLKECYQSTIIHCYCAICFRSWHYKFKSQFRVYHSEYTKYWVYIHDWYSMRILHFHISHTKYISHCLILPETQMIPHKPPPLPTLPPDQSWLFLNRTDPISK